MQSADTAVRTRLAPLLLSAWLAAWLAACGGSSDSGSAPPPPADPPAGDPPAGGLDMRPVNLTCTAPARETTTAGVALTRVFPNQTFSQPLGMLQAPADDSRWFVLEKGGRVMVFDNDAGVSTAAEFIDLTEFGSVDTTSEGGLLGMAFDPDFANNGQVFLSWTSGPPMVSVIARFTSNDGGATLDPGTQTNLLTLEQDFSNHNGGQIAFGADGLLYIGFGDGGSGGDPLDRAQETRNLPGSLLRIDIDGSPYGIPADNPFAGNAACPADPDVLIDDCPEIYAWGLRNPWRFSFDRATGQLWLGDVGQNSLEEIDIIERGGNYGWDCREGTNAFSSPSAACGTVTGLIDPVHAYPRSAGASVTGGYVYRGSAIPSLAGDYVFGDFVSGRIWRLVGDGQGGYLSEQLLDSGLSIASFGEDVDGELYVVDLGGGLYRLDDAGSGNGADPVPDQLSATGCVSSMDPAAPAAGLIPYTVAAPFWSDGATKERWIALPENTTISRTADGDFDLPPGAVAMKHFRIGQQLVETRLLMHHPDGSWAGYSYAWAADGTDASRVRGGRVDRVAGQDWIFPSEAECDACHTAAAGFSLGLETAQLNREFSYPATGRTANQLTTLDAIGLFDLPIGDAASQPALADPADTAATLADRARASLHTNCAQCHRPGGPTPSDLDLRATTLLEATMACDVVPTAGDLGLGPDARIIAPGDPAASVLIERMARRDAQAMPPLASALVDAQSVTLISDWIATLTGCL